KPTFQVAVTRLRSVLYCKVTSSTTSSGLAPGCVLARVETTPVAIASPPLVPRTRSSHHNCRESGCELRVQSGTRIIKLLVSFDSEVRIGRAARLGELRNRDTSRAFHVSRVSFRMINKQVSSIPAALEGIRDGATILSAGFG